eukprot:COSAG06_NODE_1563_length_9093_cov_9.891495_17_plen_103_part_00
MIIFALLIHPLRYHLWLTSVLRCSECAFVESDAQWPHEPADTSWVQQTDSRTCKKLHVWRHCIPKMIILPRQARNKHGESSKQSGVFLQRTLPSQSISLGFA